MKPAQRSRNASSSNQKTANTTRLNKFLSNAGLCSRREADAHIAMGLVHVNGKVVTEMGYQVQSTDRVKFDGQRVQQVAPIYLLLNKPKGFIASSQGGKMNKSVQDLIRTASKSKVPALGDMGRPFTGLLLFTNDEKLQKKWYNSSNIHMLYHIVLDKNIGSQAMAQLKKGVLIQGKSHSVKAISHVSGGNKREIGVEVNSLSTAVLTKIFAALEFKIMQMDRVLLAGLTKRDLGRGNWRRLTEKEVSFLKMLK